MLNLAFLGKLIERIVALQVVDNIQANNLIDMFQVSYRNCHSKETALLRVQHEILMHLDNTDTVIMLYWYYLTLQLLLKQLIVESC